MPTSITIAPSFTQSPFFKIPLINYQLNHPPEYAQETIIDNLYAAMFLLSFLAFSEINLPLRNEVALLGSKSYGIYLVHSPVLEYTARIIYHFAPFILSMQILFQAILWIAGLGIPLLLMAFVDRSPFRRFYSYLFG